MLEDKVREYYLKKDANCAEAIVLGANEYYGLGLDEKAIKMASGFGKGCGCGELCGALAGALSVLSLLSVEERAHTTPGFEQLCSDLVSGFRKRLGDIHCAQVRAKFFKEEVRCSDSVTAAAQFLEQYLKEHEKTR